MVVMGTSSLQVDTLAQSNDSVRHAKLLQASQEFEAIMLEVILKPLSGGAAVGEDPDTADSAGPLQSFGIQAMAQSMAKSGALGFASRITRAVEGHAAGQTSKMNARNTAGDAQVRLDEADKRAGGNHS